MLLSCGAGFGQDDVEFLPLRARRIVCSWPAWVPGECEPSPDHLRGRLDMAAAQTMPDPDVATYRRTRPRATFGELRSAVMGDALFGAGSRALADAHADRSRAATYGYEFAWRSPTQTGDPRGQERQAWA